MGFFPKCLKSPITPQVKDPPTAAVVIRTVVVSLSGKRKTHLKSAKSPFPGKCDGFCASRRMHQRALSYPPSTRSRCEGNGIFLCEDLTRVKRKVALKVLRSDRLEDSEEWSKVEYEALTRLRHPNLAKVYDFGRVQQSHDWFIVEEFIRGDVIFLRLPLHLKSLNSSMLSFRFVDPSNTSIPRVMSTLTSNLTTYWLPEHGRWGQINPRR